MKTLALLSVGVLIVCVTPQVNASSLVESLNEDAVELPHRPSVLTLSCPASENEYYQSKISLLATDSKQYDFALTTAHGIVQGLDPNGQLCFVTDIQGERRELLKVAFAEGYRPGTSTDWAVLKLKKVKAHSYTRFALAEIESNVLSNNEPLAVSFPKAIGIGYNTQSCKIYPSEMLGIETPSILSHDCRVVPGQSGSPIAVVKDDESILVGMHLGSAFTYRSPITLQPEHMGYFRSIDPEMHKEIIHAIETLNL